MSELGEKVKASIERLKAFEPKNGEGYYLAFSGGKVFWRGDGADEQCSSLRSKR